MDKCDPEVFKNGQSLCALDARAIPAEEWVQKVAQASGQRVDWHYSGGVAHVLVLGDFAKALEAARNTPTGPQVQILRFYSPSSTGLCREGVTPIAGEVLAVDSVSMAIAGED